ncbi:MAG TPA: (2Fe-2S) ferredoxin domain-containing protein [Myxococcaceae bacterium]|nr:(2Fe-2S) ferredoxin domain-containing protein [Myxococcaceae bacterium]
MKRYRVSVCKGPDCRAGGAEEVFTALRSAVQASPVKATCAVGRGGCYGLCHLGPNVVIRLDDGRPKDPLSREDFQLMGWDGETHYGNMTAARIPRLVEEHLQDDREIADYAPVDNGRQPPPSSTG